MTQRSVQNTLIIFALFLWWIGVGGSDLYAIPALFGLGMWAWSIYQGSFKVNFQKNLSQIFQWREEKTSRQLVFGVFGLHIIIFLLLTWLKYYSFHWNIWDVGIHSNILYNISQGEFYTSYFQVHNWADHFTPSMSLLSLFYVITPSTHWLTFSKVIAFILTPYAMFQVCRHELKDKTFVWRITLLLSTTWLLLYAPILNSVYFEFQASTLAAPLIFYAFLCFRKAHWFRFFLSLLFLAGLKEHAASIWIGLGCYVFLNTPRKKSGILLTISGAFLVYLFIFQAMPYFRDYRPTWNFVLGPFESIDQKIIYGIRLLWPLGFLPLIYWRYGILAAPAIGVNLMAGAEKAVMYSTNYHYDDLVSPLLFLALILIFKDWKEEERFHCLLNSKWKQSWLLLTFLGMFALLPASPMRKVWEAIPNSKHWAIHKELQEFDLFSKGKSISIQTGLGAHIHRREIREISRSSVKACGKKESDYFVLAQGINYFRIDDFEACVQDLSGKSDYKRLTNYTSLIVFEKQTP